MNKIPQFFTKDFIMDLLKFHLATLRVKERINKALAVKSNWLRKDIDQYQTLFHKIAQESLDNLESGEWQLIGMASFRYEDVMMPGLASDEYSALNRDLKTYINNL